LRTQIPGSDFLGENGGVVQRIFFLDKNLRDIQRLATMEV
jgi:hypothetical protein